MLKSRFLSFAPLALAGCSGAGDPPAEAPDAAASETATAPTTTPTDNGTPAAELTATPTAEPTSGPSAKPSATPKVPAGSAAPPVEPIAAVAMPPASYARCAVCHTADKGGEDKLGPNLYGTYGSAAAQGGFAYSDALKNSGLSWTDENLHKWLENPRALVPGNRMSFPGLKDAAKRQEIIDYLKKQR